MHARADVVCDAFYSCFEYGVADPLARGTLPYLLAKVLFYVMGVNVSRPERRNRLKYIQADDYDEGEHFFNESSQQESAREKTIRGTNSSSKRNEPGFFQLKSGKGKTKCTFDSLDTIDSRKSVPFAVLPENSYQTSTSSPSGDENEDLKGVFSVEEGIVSGGKGGRVLFVDEPTDDLEQGEDFAEKCVENLKEKDTTRHSNCFNWKVISSHSRSKNKNSNRMSSLATQREPGDGKEDGLEI